MAKETQELISEVRTYINLIQVNLDEFERRENVEHLEHSKSQGKPSIFSDEKKAKIRADRRKKKMMLN